MASCYGPPACKKRLVAAIEKGLQLVAEIEERKNRKPEPPSIEGFETLFPMTPYDIVEFVLSAKNLIEMCGKLMHIKCFQANNINDHFIQAVEINALLDLGETELASKVLLSFTKINGSEFLAALTKYCIYFCYRQSNGARILKWNDLFLMNTGREETWRMLFEQHNSRHKDDEVQTLMTWIILMPNDAGISRRVERAFDLIAKLYKTQKWIPPCIHIFLQKAFSSPHNYIRVNKNSVDDVVWPFVRSKYLEHVHLVSENGTTDDPAHKPGQSAFLTDTCWIAGIALGIRNPAERQFFQAFFLNPQSHDIATPSVPFVKYIAQYVKLGMFPMGAKDKLIAWNYYYDDRWCGYDRNDLFGRDVVLSEMFHYSQPFKKVGPINQHPHCISLMICARLFGWMNENPKLYDEILKEHGDETFVQYACIALSFAGMFDCVQKLYYEQFSKMKSRQAKICLSINFMYACAKKGMAEACLNVWAYVVRKTLKSGESVALELPSTPLDQDIDQFSLPPFVHHKYARHFAFRLLRNGLWTACVNGGPSAWSKYGLLILHLCEHLESSFLNHNMVRSLMAKLGDAPSLVIQRGYTQAIRHLSTYNHILSVVAEKDPELLKSIETPPLIDFKPAAVLETEEEPETKPKPELEVQREAEAQYAPISQIRPYVKVVRKISGPSCVETCLETYFKLKTGWKLFEEVLKDFAPDAFKTEPRIIWKGEKGSADEGKVMYEGMEMITDDEEDVNEKETNDDNGKDLLKDKESRLEDYDSDDDYYDPYRMNKSARNCFGSNNLTFAMSFRDGPDSEVEDEEEEDIEEVRDADAEMEVDKIEADDGADVQTNADTDSDADKEIETSTTPTEPKKECISLGPYVWSYFFGDKKADEVDQELLATLLAPQEVKSEETPAKKSEETPAKKAEETPEKKSEKTPEKNDYVLRRRLYSPCPSPPFIMDPDLMEDDVFEPPTEEELNRISRKRNYSATLIDQDDDHNGLDDDSYYDDTYDEAFREEWRQQYRQEHHGQNYELHRESYRQSYGEAYREAYRTAYRETYRESNCVSSLESYHDDSNHEYDSSCYQYVNNTTFSWDSPAKSIVSTTEEELEEEPQEEQEEEPQEEPQEEPVVEEKEIKTKKDRRRLFSYDSDSSGCEPCWRPSDFVEELDVDEPMDEAAPIEEQKEEKEEEKSFDQPMSPDATMVEDVKDVVELRDSPEEPEELNDLAMATPTEPATIPLEGNVTAPVAIPTEIVPIEETIAAEKPTEEKPEQEMLKEPVIDGAKPSEDGKIEEKVPEQLKTEESAKDTIEDVGEEKKAAVREEAVEAASDEVATEVVIKKEDDVLAVEQKDDEKTSGEPTQELKEEPAAPAAEEEAVEPVAVTEETNA